MNKVLIISYFAPPCQLTSSNRIGSWLEYLPAYNYKPVLVTRIWTGEEMTDQERLESTGKDIERIVEDDHEIYRLPYRQIFRDFLFSKKQESIFFALSSKLFTFFNLVFRNFFSQIIPFFNLYEFSRQYLLDHPAVDLVLISGNPYEQYFFGYLLKKEFPRIRWVADYRDEWNTSLVYRNSRLNIPLLSILEKRSELKWMSNAAAIQTVCPFFTKGLGSLHQRQIEVVPNGFDSTFERFLKVNPQVKDGGVLHLVFSGTLFHNQAIDILLEALDQFDQGEICVEFVGSKINHKDHRISLLSQKRVLKLTSWIPKSDMIELMRLCDGFLMFPFKAMKGMPSSKLYDYLPFRKPIFLIPSDEDIIEEILTETQLGIVCNSLDSLVETLQECINLKREGKALIPLADVADIIPYSRKEAVKIQVEIFNKIISQK